MRSELNSAAYLFVPGNRKLYPIKHKPPTQTDAMRACKRKKTEKRRKTGEIKTEKVQSKKIIVAVSELRQKAFKSSANKNNKRTFASTN